VPGQGRLPGPAEEEHHDRGQHRRAGPEQRCPQDAIEDLISLALEFKPSVDTAASKPTQEPGLVDLRLWASCEDAK
jgi:hypothetical protein